MGPLPSTTQATASIYTARAPNYDTGANSLHVRQTQTYISHLTPSLHPGGSLLDLACGTGLLTLPAKRLLGPHGRVVGIDVSPGMLEVARQKAAEQELDVEWYEHDISDLSALELGDTGLFDVITCAAALVLLPSPEDAVRGWLQLIKPGGRIMTDVHVAGSNIVMDVFADIGPDVGERLKWDVTRFTMQDSLCGLFERAGLEVEKVWESEVYKTYEIGVVDAKAEFDKAVQSPMFANFTAQGVKERAKEAFVKRLKELGGAEGKMKEETRSWMIIGRKQAEGC